jgi:RHS repeat-associated protein
MNTNTLINYRYDALDRLIALDIPGQADIIRHYDHNHLLSQTQGEQDLTFIGHDDSISALSKTAHGDVTNTLIGTDHQGSTLHNFEGDGVGDFLYLPYGWSRQVDPLNDLLGFNGEHVDPVTGCYMLGNGYRAYNPVLMRFNSPDSMSPFGAGGVNPYAYCVGDPINLSDPTGHFSWRSIFKIVVSVAAIAIAVVTLGVGAPIAASVLAAAAITIGTEVISIAETVVKELAPDSTAATILGGISGALSVATLILPDKAAKSIAKRGTRVAARVFRSKPVSIARQGAVRVNQARRVIGPAAGIGRWARNTVLIERRINRAARYLGNSQYISYPIKAYETVDSYLMPYFRPPGQSDDAPSMVQAFTYGNSESNSGGPGAVDILTRSQLQAQEIRGA